jgi:hypothetical protein
MFETKIEEEPINIHIPCLGGLFQTIQGFLQSTHKTNVLLEAYRFLHKNILGEITM